MAMGYAEGYRGTPCQEDSRDFEDAEAMARRDRVGLWAQASYESPAAFRRRLQLAEE